MKSKTATSKCCPDLSEGIDRFSESFSIDSPDCRSPTFYSLFSLLRSCIEEPLKTILNNSNALEAHKHLLPSRLLDVHRSIKNDNLPRYLNYQAVLEAWQIDLKYVAQSTKVESIYEAVESLLFLVYELRTIIPHTSKLMINSTDAKSTFRTQRVAFRGKKYCSLCWRFTQKYKATEGGIYNYSTSGRSSQLCDYHDRNTPEGLKNYMRDQRYKKIFKNEISALHKPDRSKYFPTINWYNKFLNDLTYQEKRKLAYELACSGLHKDTYLKVLEQLSEGKSNPEISRILGKSRNTVSRTIKIAKEKINYILRNCYLHRDTDTESNVDRQLRVFDALIWAQQEGIHDKASEIARCYHKVREIPILSEICIEASNHDPL